jgi:hypothetical protein
VVACSIASERRIGVLRAACVGPSIGLGTVRPAKAPTCAHCGDVIGVYEPLILTRDGQVRETSLAAERDLPLARATHFHRACYTARERDAAASA